MSKQLQLWKVSIPCLVTKCFRMNCTVNSSIINSFQGVWVPINLIDNHAKCPCNLETRLIEAPEVIVPRTTSIFTTQIKVFIFSLEWLVFHYHTMGNSFLKNWNIFLEAFLMFTVKKKIRFTCVLKSIFFLN